MCGRARFLSLLAFALVAGLVAVVPAAQPANATNIVGADQHDRLVSEIPAPGTPQILDTDGKVEDISRWGDQIVVGGDFTSIREFESADSIAQTGVFMYDPATGEIDDRFRPQLNGRVRAVEVLPDGSGVVVGGYFWQVNGEYRPNLVLLDRDGQRISGWRGRPDGPVFDTAIAGGVLYVAGFFDEVNDEEQAVLAAINLSDGELSSEMALEIAAPRFKEFRGRLEMVKMDVSPDGSTLVALGNFTRVDGLVRDQVLAVDVSTSPDTVANWSTAYFDNPCDKFDTIWPYHVRDVSISPDGTYMVISNVGGGAVYPHTCDQANRFELDTPGLDQLPTWTMYSGGDSVLSAEVTSSAVYIGGHFRWVNNPFGSNFQGDGGVPRGTITALDPDTGLPLPWNPGRDPRGQGVVFMEADENGLFLGHDTGFVNELFRPGMAYMPLLGGTELPALDAPAVPGDLFAVGGGAIDSRSYDGTVVGSATSMTTGDSRFAGAVDGFPSPVASSFSATESSAARAGRAAHSRTRRSSIDAISTTSSPPPPPSRTTSPRSGSTGSPRRVSCGGAGSSRSARFSAPSTSWPTWPICPPRASSAWPSSTPPPSSLSTPAI